MNRTAIRLAAFCLVLAVGAGLATAVAATDVDDLLKPAGYVKIKKSGVNIRASASTSSGVIAVAQAGDIFEVARWGEGDWIAIKMFSGEYRYVHRDLAARIEYSPALPALSVRKKIFRECWRAEERAEREAVRQTSDIMLQIDIERALIDRYKLELFRENGVQQPAYIDIAAQGASEGWMN